MQTSPTQPINLGQLETLLLARGMTVVMRKEGILLCALEIYPQTFKRLFHMLADQSHAEQGDLLRTSSAFKTSGHAPHKILRLANGFNSVTTFGRAFFDHGDLIFESELRAANGATQDHLERFVDAFFSCLVTLEAVVAAALRENSASVLGSPEGTRAQV